MLMQYVITMSFFFDNYDYYCIIVMKIANVIIKWGNNQTSNSCKDKISFFNTAHVVHNEFLGFL